MMMPFVFDAGEISVVVPEPGTTVIYCWPSGITPATENLGIGWSSDSLGILLEFSWNSLGRANLMVT
jgi:hypothetical protein